MSATNVEVDGVASPSLAVVQTLRGGEEGQYITKKVKNARERTYREEIGTLVLKVEHRRVADEDGEGTAHQRRVVADHRVEDLAVSRGEVDEVGRRRVGELVDDEEGLDEGKKDGREVEEVRLRLDAGEGVTESLPEIGEGERAVDALNLLLFCREGFRRRLA